MELKGTRPLVHRSKPKKERLDRLLVSHGFVETREKARALVMAGAVEVDGRPAHKPGKAYRWDVSIVIREDPNPYVGRGGLKLEAALDHFGVDVRGRVAVDVGSSTGGFTDCLLQRGALKVFAVDVGYGQLHYRLRSDPRVRIMERVNIRHLEPDRLDPAPDLATVDVSFISLRIVLPAVERLLCSPKEILALVKPQFEVGPREVGKGGIVRDPRLHSRVLEEISEVGRGLGLRVAPPFASPIVGAKGNLEFFLHLRSD